MISEMLFRSPENTVVLFDKRSERLREEDEIVGRMIREVLSHEGCLFTAEMARTLDAICDRAIGEARSRGLDWQHVDLVSRRWRAVLSDGFEFGRGI